MGRVCYVVFFVICSLLLLSKAHEAKRSNGNCQFLPCGKIGDIHFPFTDRRYPECGLLIVDNCDKPDGIPKIHLGNKVPPFYISHISDDYIMILHNKEQLARNPWNFPNNTCELLENISLPSHPFLSFKLPFNVPMFICPPSQVIPKNFILTCKNSKNSILLYKEAPTHHHVPNPLPHCSLVPFLNKTEKGVELLNLYAGIFLLKVQVTEECKKCHYVRGGQCKSDNRGKFHCSNPKTGNGKLGLALGLGGSAALLLVLFLCIISYRKKRKYSSPSFNSRYASPDPSSKSEAEIGSVYYGVTIFSYGELAKATNDFGHEKELGNGGFGKVYYAKLHDGREVAVKRLYEHNYRRVEQFMNEVKILTRLCHKNLVSLYGCTSHHSQQGLLLVYEYVPNGTVADHLYGGRAKAGSLTWSTRMNIAIETASALAYLHASDIIHRDVKTNNILLDNSFCVKVADFGLSRLFPLDVTHVSTAPQGSPGYIDPEYHQCYQLTNKSDVYSFGVVLIELISSLPAVDTSRQKDDINLANLAINKIQKGAIKELVDPNLGYQSDAEVKRMTTAVAELAFLCLQQKKEMRPSMNAVLEELKRIESGESNLKNLKEKKDNNDVLKIMQPLPSPVPDYDNIALLKRMRVSSSPISVSADWVSSKSTWSTSNVSS